MDPRQLNHWGNVLISLPLYSGNPVGKKLLSDIVFPTGLDSDTIRYSRNNSYEERLGHLGVTKGSKASAIQRRQAGYFLS